MQILPRHLEMKLQPSMSLSPFPVHHAHFGNFSPLQFLFSRLVDPQKTFAMWGDHSQEVTDHSPAVPDSDLRALLLLSG